MIRFFAKNHALQNLVIPGVTIVRTQQQAQQALDLLYQNKDRVHAWDTETTGVNPKIESPVGKGQILCATAFIGPEVNFGNGPRLFIDNYGDAENLLLNFKDYFENPQIFKTWHNYSFDKHVLMNSGIDVQGLGGDTMHMARLAHSSRGSNEYSLGKCTKYYHNQIHRVRSYLLSQLIEKGDEATKQNLQLYVQSGDLKSKKGMKEIFQKQKVLPSGKLSKLTEQPDTIELHTSEQFVENWVKYAVLDAEVTWFLREALISELQQFQVNTEDVNNLWEFYMKYWIPFCNVLIGLERRGMFVNLQYLKEIEKQAKKDKFAFYNEFYSWVCSLDPQMHYFNAQSTQHMQQLLFAPFERLQDDQQKEAPNELRKSSNIQSKFQSYFPQERVFSAENKNWKNDQTDRISYFSIKGLGIPVVSWTESGMPSADAKVLKTLAGEPSQGKFGKAYQHLASQGQEELGKACCYALDCLIKYKQTETLLTNFITPLQRLTDKDGRLHYSININTETGRLSAKRPNTQNQPALDKDKYKIRRAFQAEPGNLLIVADYGQLELRILAHMTNCNSMIEAFKLGGDFHSRTAIGMYDYIKQAVDSKQVLLEWDNSQGEAPAPLLKNVYAAERKTAKTMNFSIAYGKSAHGFASDWGCSLEEAQQALKRWYSDRKEVESWQKAVRQLAIQKGYTRTLLGRYRRLTDLVRHKDGYQRQHGLRAAINTPIQGGAADIVNSAMIRLFYDNDIHQLGWKLLMQIHDEVILEGPEQHAEEVLKRVKFIMENPLDSDLRLKLEVDAKIADNWYDAK